MNKIITHLYDVKSVRLVRRCDLSVEQAGKTSDSVEEYWLIELGYARQLTQQMEMAGRSFRFLLTNATQFVSATRWEDLPKRYTLLA